MDAAEEVGVLKSEGEANGPGRAAGAARDPHLNHSQRPSLRAALHGRKKGVSPLRDRSFEQRVSS